MAGNTGECTCLLTEIQKFCPQDGNAKGLKQKIYVAKLEWVEEITYQADPDNAGEFLHCIENIALKTGETFKEWNISKNDQQFNSAPVDAEDCEDTTMLNTLQFRIAQTNKLKSTTLKRAQGIELLVIAVDKNGCRRVLGVLDDGVFLKYSVELVAFNGYTVTIADEAACEPFYLDEAYVIPT